MKLFEVMSLFNLSSIWHFVCLMCLFLAGVYLYNYLILRMLLRILEVLGFVYIAFYLTNVF